MLALPDRIRTGHMNRTIPVPSRLQLYNVRDRYEGPAKEYDFLKQTDNYKKLSKALAKYGLQFTDVSALLYEGDRGYNQRFVAMTNHPFVFWYKYVGYAAQGGQNHIWVSGRRIKVSRFLACSQALQKALIANDYKTIIKVAVKDKMIKSPSDEIYWLNEGRYLWS